MQDMTRTLKRGNASPEAIRNCAAAGLQGLDSKLQAHSIATWISARVFSQFTDAVAALCNPSMAAAAGQPAGQARTWALPKFENEGILQIRDRHWGVREYFCVACEKPATEGHMDSFKKHGTGMYWWNQKDMREKIGHAIKAVDKEFHGVADLTAMLNSEPATSALLEEVLADVAADIPVDGRGWHVARRHEPQPPDLESVRRITELEQRLADLEEEFRRFKASWGEPWAP